jgi:hypothetical protein
MPNAPADMFCGLGKNNQLLNVAPSQGIVLVRLGNDPDPDPNTPSVSIILDDQIWQYMNALSCNSGIADPTASRELTVHPNPCSDRAQIDLPAGKGKAAISMINALGRTVLSTDDPLHLNVAALPAGTYTVRVVRDGSVLVGRLLKE